MFTQLRQTEIYKFIREPWRHQYKAWVSRKRLRSLYNKHSGQAGVILATGPSLERTDFTPFLEMPVIGLNRIYLAEDRFPLQPDYIICVNDLLLDQFGHEFANLECTSLVSYASRQHVKMNPRTIYLPTQAGHEFSSDPREALPVGGTVTYCALQMAFWMGFKTIYILGLDHNYTLEKNEQNLSSHDVSQRAEPDTNHFMPNYFGPGSKWQLPDLEMSEHSYSIARRIYENNNRRIVNATPGSKLKIFERYQNQ